MSNVHLSYSDKTADIANMLDNAADVFGQHAGVSAPGPTVSLDSGGFRLSAFRNIVAPAALLPKERKLIGHRSNHANAAREAAVVARSALGRPRKFLKYSWILAP